MTIGMSLPGDALTTDATEYVGILVGKLGGEGSANKRELNVS